MNNYTIYHLHDYTSNCNGYMDSTTDYKRYISFAKKNKMKAMAFSNHGGVYDWVKKKQACDDYGIKYIHGIETYLCENFEDNERGYHLGLYAKNLDGVKELNILITQSYSKGLDGKTPRQFYFNPRMSMEQIMNTSDNIIITTACLASILWRKKDEQVVVDFLQWMSKNRDRCFLEIQYHDMDDQVKYNELLYAWSKEYDIPLIAGTDTHSVDDYSAECRLILQKSKNQNYGDDTEKELDLKCKTYDELVQAFKEQDVFSEDVILDAINNTNVLADMVEEFELDYTFKYPDLYGDNGLDIWKSKIDKMLEQKFTNGVIDVKLRDRYTERIDEEIEAMQSQDMQDFMLFMSELVDFCNDNNIPYGFCRGSIGGSLVAYITDIIDVDPIVWDTVFSRFCNKDRVSLADIDIDFAPEDREKVYQYIIDRFGMNKTSYILTLGTVKDRGAIDVLAKGLDYHDLDLVAYIKNQFDEIFKKYSAIIQEEVDLESLKEDGIIESTSVDFSLHQIYLQRIGQAKRQQKAQEYFDRFEHIKEENEDLFYYFDGVRGCVIAKGHHPAGMIGSPITLHDNLSLNYRDGDTNFPICNCSMKSVDALNYVKFDILGLKNIGILKDAYNYIGTHYLKAYEIDWNDKAVWDNMIKSRTGIFQFEGDFAFGLLESFVPQKINDMSLVNASLRPSGKSYRNRLINREFNQNPSEEINKILEPNNGFLVFQEDTIKFLTDVCGFSGGLADTTRRAIGKKDKELLDEQLPLILDGYCDNSIKERKVAEEEASEFVQIIQDSSEYQFGYNHSTGYSMVGYALARLRHYYPLEFTTAYLNRADKERHILLGIDLADQLGIKVNGIKFQYSSSHYTYDKNDNTIYKGMSSIKGISASLSEQLYELRFNIYDSFLEALPDLINCGVAKDNMETLIKLNFFSAFGKSKTLMIKYGQYREFIGRKRISKGKYPPKIDAIIAENSIATPKQYKVINIDKVIKGLFYCIPDEDFPLVDTLLFELDKMGYISTRIDTIRQNCVVLEKDIQYSPKVTIMSLKTGFKVICKVTKNMAYDLHKGDLIRTLKFSKEDGWKKGKEGKWVKDPTKKVWRLNKFVKITENIL